MIGTSFVEPGQGNTVAEIVATIEACNSTSGLKSIVLSHLRSKQQSHRTKIVVGSTLDPHDLARISAMISDIP